MSKTNTRKSKRVETEKAKPGSLHPVVRPIVVELNFDPNKDPISAGFRVNWIDGQNDESEINLSCGAGVGTPFMVFSRKDKKTGKLRYAVCDIRPMLNVLSEALA